MIFDYDNGEYIYNASGSRGYSSDGNMYMRIGSNMAMNMDTGEYHFCSSWDDDDDDDDEW